jgi:hypothetical protein
MQGLAGVNALTPQGRAQLAFCKRHIDAVTRQFLQLRTSMQQEFLQTVKDVPGIAF